MTTQETAPAVLITGAGSGIGEACAKRLSGMGWRVFAGVFDEAQRSHLQQNGLPRMTSLMLDITNTEAISAAVQTIAADVGNEGLAGLVNNAGIGVMGPLEYVPINRLRLQLEVNLIGHVAVTQACLPLLRRAAGRIVNIASLAGRMTMPLLGPYAASKFAMEAVSDTLRLELKPWNMHVACIEPGLIDTPILSGGQAAADAALTAMPEVGRDQYRRFFESMRRNGGINRAASPPDVVARAVAHALMSRRPKPRYVVGGMRWRFVLMSKLPDRLRDWVISNMFS